MFIMHFIYTNNIFTYIYNIVFQHFNFSKKK
jgi:hypothetical protein